MGRKARAGVAKRHYYVEDRRHWISVLSRASLEQLRFAYEGLEFRPSYRVTDRARSIRVMGAWFTRCAVETEYGEDGTACVPGRSVERARLVAVFDAMLQREERYDQLVSDVIDPLYFGGLDGFPPRSPVSRSGELESGNCQAR